MGQGELSILVACTREKSAIAATKNNRALKCHLSLLISEQQHQPSHDPVATMADHFLGFDLSTQQLKGARLPHQSYPAIPL